MAEVANQINQKEVFSATVESFIENLYKLNRGEKAVLKRNAGFTLAESRGAMSIFYRILPPRLLDCKDEEIYFLIATLFGLNELSHQGDFGTTMQLIKTKSQSENTDRRMKILLDSEFSLIDGFRPGGGEMAYRLRQCVKLAKNHEIGVEWLELLKDLRYWSYPEKRIQKKWARSYYGTKSLKNNE
jgi:CRISPR system Cascade subunit CasB